DFFGLERFPFEKRNRLVEDRPVAGNLEIMNDAVGKPEQVVGDPCAHSFSRRGMPPVLNIPFAELARRGGENLGPSDVAPRDRQSQRVLQLVAEPESSSRLVEGGAPPDPAGEGLIE